MAKESKNREARQEQKTEEAPQVYVVQKDLTGWRFSRRDFLAAAGAAAAGALATGCGPTASREERARMEACKDIRAHTHSVAALATSPDGTLLASAGADKTIKLWSLPEGTLLKTLKGHTDEVWGLAVSPDGTLLASASNDGTIRLWSLPEGEFVSCLMDLAANEPDVEGVTYELETASGQTIEYTLPCGAPIPPGAVCVCNCVAGSYVPPPCSCVGDTAPSCTCVGYTAPSVHYWHPC